MANSEGEPIEFGIGSDDDIDTKETTEARGQKKNGKSEGGSSTDTDAIKSDIMTPKNKFDLLNPRTASYSAVPKVTKISDASFNWAKYTENLKTYCIDCIPVRFAASTEALATIISLSFLKHYLLNERPYLSQYMLTVGATSIEENVIAAECSIELAIEKEARPNTWPWHKINIELKLTPFDNEISRRFVTDGFFEFFQDFITKTIERSLIVLFKKAFRGEEITMIKMYHVFYPVNVEDMLTLIESLVKEIASILPGHLNEYLIFLHNIVTTVPDLILNKAGLLDEQTKFLDRNDTLEESDIFAKIKFNVIRLQFYYQNQLTRMTPQDPPNVFLFNTPVDVIEYLAKTTKQDSKSKQSDAPPKVNTDAIYTELRNTFDISPDIDDRDVLREIANVYNDLQAESRSKEDQDTSKRDSDDDNSAIISDLRTQLQEAKEKLVKKDELISELTGELTAATDENDNLAAELNTTKQDLSDANAEKTRLQSVNNTLSATTTEAQRANAERVAEDIRVLTEQVDAANAALTAANTALTTATEDLAARTTERDAKEAARAEAVAAETQAQARLTTTTANLRAVEAELTDLRNVAIPKANHEFEQIVLRLETANYKLLALSQEQIPKSSVGIGMSLPPGAVARGSVAFIYLDANGKVIRPPRSARPDAYVYLDSSNRAFRKPSELEKHLNPAITEIPVQSYFSYNFTQQVLAYEKLY